MTADLIRELQQIQRYAAGLHGMLAQAQAQAPRHAEGSDRSGSVRVVLGPDGFPETIRVDAGWERRLAPEAFGGAVGEAFSAAMGERLAEWTDTLSQQGWQAGVDRLRSDVEHGRRPAPAATVPPALRRATRPGRPRPLDAVTEDLIRAFDTVDAFAAPARPAAGAGEAASGRLTVTLAANGALSCTADPQWVSRQSAAGLMSALNEALHEARADLDRQLERRTDRGDGHGNGHGNGNGSGSGRHDDRGAGPATGRLDSLLGEAFALLANPRSADS